MKKDGAVGRTRMTKTEEYTNRAFVYDESMYSMERGISCES